MHPGLGQGFLIEFWMSPHRVQAHLSLPSVGTSDIVGIESSNTDMTLPAYSSRMVMVNTCGGGAGECIEEQQEPLVCLLV